MQRVGRDGDRLHRDAAEIREITQRTSAMLSGRRGIGPVGTTEPIGWMSTLPSHRPLRCGMRGESGAPVRPVDVRWLDERLADEAVAIAGATGPGRTTGSCRALTLPAHSYNLTTTTPTASVPPKHATRITGAADAPESPYGGGPSMCHRNR